MMLPNTLVSPHMLFDALLIVSAYFIGSVSTAIITCKLMGLPDPRTTGSNNPGATNVLRLGGKKAAIITLTGDLIKGLLPTLAAVVLGRETDAIALTGLAAFLGHLYPIFFGFKGGKGVATALGVYFGMTWLAGALFVCLWLIMATITRISSLSALTATLAMPVFFFYIEGPGWMGATTGIIAALIYWRHRSNIRNIIHGNEKKIGHRD
jgi:glycerol-3-phosphate acyltransferase PlsY